MNPTTLARALAINRILYGVAVILFPTLTNYVWVGRGARKESTRVMSRAVGARDLALGVGSLRALDSPDDSRPWFAAHLVADVTDATATLAAKQTPLLPRLIALTAATGSAAISGASLAGALGADEA